MQETQVWSLGREDPLEKEMSTHSSTLVWKIPWTEEPGRLQSMGPQRVGHDWATSLSYSCWEGFVSSSLVMLTLGFNCDFIPTCACGLSTEVCSWGYMKDLLLPKWEPGVDAVQLFGSQGPWKHQVLREIGVLGSCKYGALEGYDNPLQYSCLENPLDREAWQATVHRVAKSWIWLKWPHVHRCRTFSCPWQLCPGEYWAWRCRNCLGHGNPSNVKCAGTWTGFF